MYNAFKLASKYMQYFITSTKYSAKSIDNAFVSWFGKHILQPTPPVAIVTKVENIRAQLQQNQEQLLIDDFGAGSVYSKQQQRTVASIASSALKHKKYAFVLFNIVKAYNHKVVLELGTSLGITTSYLALANPQASIITFEGASAIAAQAKNTFIQANANNIKLVLGNIDNTLQNEINHLPTIDLAFIDGNHRYQPTVHYFNTILQKVHSNSVVVLDDIHWSKEMEEAWAYAKNHQAVTLSIDLFFIGLVFFKKQASPKQHFVIRY